jgi:hypothetical protein
MTSSGSTRFLLDGYPRNLEQLKEFQQQVLGHIPMMTG